jgi:hypothetical protein
MHFPVLLSLGKCIPFLDRIMGRNFPLERLWESVSHFDRPEWNALSAKHLNGKLRPIPKANSGTHFRKPAHPESPSHFGRIRARNHRPIRPPINKEASSRTAGHEVHREFRTQRRPLNVAFVLRRTVEQGTSCPDAREDVSFRKMDRPPSAMGATPQARPFWRLQPCCPGLPWWDGPSRQPSCRAAS